jgi:hypothetical protein
MSAGGPTLGRELGCDAIVERRGRCDELVRLERAVLAGGAADPRA